MMRNRRIVGNIERLHRIHQKIHPSVNFHSTDLTDTLRVVIDDWGDMRAIHGNMKRGGVRTGKLQK